MGYLRSCFRETISGDRWGCTINWLFHIADEMYFNRELSVPKDWQYKPSPGGSQNEPGTFETETVENASDEELAYFGKALNRHAGFLRKAGLDY